MDVNRLALILPPFLQYSQLSVYSLLGYSFFSALFVFLRLVGESVFGYQQFLFVVVEGSEPERLFPPSKGNG